MVTAMKPAPTLIDHFYRQSFGRETVVGWKSNARMRESLTAARRFVLDSAMSAFMADLAVASFSFSKTNFGSLASKLSEQLRVSARAPHKAIWIEYDHLSFQNRSNDLRGLSPPDPKEIPQREGWLIEQHPQVETAFIMHLFSWAEDDVFYTFPVAYAWTTDDSPLPWNTIVDQRMATDDDNVVAFLSELIVGVPGYQTTRVGIVRSPLIIDAHPEIHDPIKDLVIEWAGTIRRTWALLATINDIPLEKKFTVAAKGFISRGQYRKFLNHSTLTLAIPGRADPRKVARNLVALARRRAHQVRGHWRLDYRHPGDPLCQHQWNVEQRCACGAHRSWVHEHQRGDASVGFVTHSYAVTHKDQP